ncbi:beta-hexosaminidase 3 [Andrographis paniculata]|uniref:beta-hexosaminidase 3 n=1 Tax=Andrographis paniculata TaxID=175694 RepID=UPI0021E81F4A|nr:beta-hexosaminidase 3 [Andrographis paniculata]XP_051140175.1 beta-hexosaminidase 3 [Andrographis paniculata]
MGGRMLILCWLVLLISVDDAAAAEVPRVLNIWPMPASVNYGDGRLHFSPELQLKTEGSRFDDGSGILEDAFSRTVDIIRGSHAVENNLPKIESSLALKGIHVVIASPSDELQHGINESYSLQVPAKGSPLYAHIEAETVYGALHALQTFSQLCHFDIKSRGILVHHVPLTIVDQPRFPYRGVLIDTSRHYQPLPMIKKVIDSMAYAKLNVLHWHIVDTQSFPLEIPSFPRLWDGAYSVSERYTFADAAEVVSYAKKRGINVLAEIDVPGHAQSWGVGYPSLWPSEDCKEPLDVSNEFTFKLIDGILSDFSKIFKYKFVHLGGDEVNTSCWETTPHVQKWLREKGMTGPEAYQYFVLRAQKIALSRGYEIINWEETFNNFGSKLDRRTIVHNWLGSNVAPAVVKAGLRCIVSNQDKWYLDHLDALWEGFYSNEPLTNISDPAQQALVLGGEVCLWGEHVDASDLEQTLWPRAAAAAERLWTPYAKIARRAEQVRQRLAYFRCLLTQRGVAAAPLVGFGRSAPVEPNSCYLQ